MESHDISGFDPQGFHGEQGHLIALPDEWKHTATFGLKAERGSFIEDGFHQFRNRLAGEMQFASSCNEKAGFIPGKFQRVFSF